METKFVHMSDPHLFRNYEYNGVGYYTNTLFEEALEKLKTDHSEAEILFMTGDLIDDGSVEGYEYLKAMIEEHWGKPAYFCLGNHDNRENFNKVFLNKDSDKPYYCSHVLPGGEICLIILDTGSVNSWPCTVDETQMQWIKETVAEIDMPIMIMTHHPLFTAVEKYQFGIKLDNPPELYEILADKNIIAVCSGHVHGAFILNTEKFPVLSAEAIGFGLKPKEDGTNALTDQRGYNSCIINNGIIMTKRIRLS